MKVFIPTLFLLIVNIALPCYNVDMGAAVKAFAKLNLTLAIKGVENGFHMLDSLVCTVDIYDSIKLKKRRDKLISIEMHGRGLELLPYENNNAVKAAQAYIDRFDTCGVDIVIYKNIPVGAGMGGSSADISGVIRGMNRLYGLGSESELKELADGLGSDTGYLLTGGFARLTGRGEKVEPLKVKCKLNALILVPKGGVCTAQCYKLYDETEKLKLSSELALNALFSGHLDWLGANLNNALYPAATLLNPDIFTAYEELKSFSPLGVNMTGSGSAVFALFESAEMCAYVKSRYRGKFECIQTKTVVPK